MTWDSKIYNMKQIQLNQVDLLRLLLAASLIYFVISAAAPIKSINFVNTISEDTTTVPSWMIEQLNK